MWRVKTHQPSGKVVLKASQEINEFDGVMATGMR